MTGPDLPAPYRDAVASSDVEYGRRVVVLSLDGPGHLHRCQFERAWLHVQEAGVGRWANEATHVSCRRRPARSGPFPPAASAKIASDILAPVNAYGFGRWWGELQAAREALSDAHHRHAAERLRATARWWDDRADLAAAFAAGLVDLRPLDHDPAKRAPTVPVIDGHGSWSTATPVAAALMADEHVGWWTSAGTLVPVESPRHRHRTDGPVAPQV